MYFPRHDGGKERNGRGSMTKQEKIIVSAYTGVLMCEFPDVHKYIEEKLGRPVWTHELANEDVWDLIREKTRDDFLKLCRGEEE